MAGQHEVCAQFSRIEWGAVPNPYEDFGIDVLVHARDAQGNDKGLLVGVQVKTGKSYFKEAVKEKDLPKGWIFRESNREHLDYWLDHALPQLVVLHDPSSRESYWVHVTAAAITRTTKGWKILVPSQNRIDGDHAAALLDVAASGRAAVSLEGSIWSRGALNIAPSREWRHALIAPRLIAPHPNAGPSLELSPVAAVGLVVERRINDYQRFAEIQPDVPSLGDAEHSAVWGWRFVWSVDSYFQGRGQPALDRAEDAPDSAARTAATIVAMCALSVADRHAEANALAARVLVESSDLTPADEAWLLIQRARALVQLGAVEDGRIVAMEGQRLLSGEPPDVTVSAIAGAASWLLWSTAAWRSGDLADVVWRNDTAVSWWRDQTTSAGLGTFLDHSFEGWAESSSVEFNNRDPVEADLLTAIATADFSAEYGSFNTDRRLLARYYSMAAESEMLQRRAIDWLRQSGDRSSLELIVRRYLGEGPIAPVKDAADAIGPNSWTYSGLEGNLALWQTAGDVMSPWRAEAAFAVSLDAFSDGTFPIARSHQSKSMVRAEALGSLAGLATATSLETHTNLLLRLSDFLGSKILNDTAIAMKLDALLNWVDWSGLDSEPRERWLSSATSPEASAWAPSATVLAALAESDERARCQLIELAKSGSWSALHKLRDVNVLGEEAAASLIATLEQGVEQIVRDARSGSHGIGGWSLPPILVWMNQCVPEVARWEGVINLLNEASVSAREKAETCTQLAANIDSISDEARARLIDVASHPISATTDWPSGDFDMPGAAFLLRISLGLIEGGDRLRRLPELISAGDCRSRATAAEILGFLRDLNEFEVGVLATLARDPSLQVRKEAVESISRQIARGVRHPAALGSLEVALRVESVEIPYRALAGLSRKSSSLPDSTLRTISSLGENHVSGKVRRLAKRIVIAYSGNLVR
jgi:hypothetical protein